MRQAAERKDSNPFFLFLQEKKKSISTEYPDLSPNEIVKIIGDVWRKLPSEEKEAYSIESSRQKMKFEDDYDQCALQTKNSYMKKALSNGRQRNVIDEAMKIHKIQNYYFSILFNRKYSCTSPSILNPLRINI